MALLVNSPLEILVSSVQVIVVFDHVISILLLYGGAWNVAREQNAFLMETTQRSEPFIYLQAGVNQPMLLFML